MYECGKISMYPTQMYECGKQMIKLSYILHKCIILQQNNKVIMYPTQMY